MKLTVVSIAWPAADQQHCLATMIKGKLTKKRDTAGLLLQLSISEDEEKRRTDRRTAWKMVIGSDGLS